jgi:transcriptional regulator with XRE-family HTH domain
VSVAEQFGRNLRQARRRVDLTQDQVAILAAVHRTEIGLLERGLRTPRIDTLAKLTRALEVSADDLMAGIEWMPPAPIRPGRFRESGR